MWGGWGSHGHMGSNPQWQRNRYANYGHNGPNKRGLLNILDDEEMGKIYDHKVVIRFLPYIKPYLFVSIISVIFMFLYTGTLVSIPWLVGYTIDRYVIAGIKTGNVSGINTILLIFISIGLLNYIGNYLYLRTISWVSQRILYDLRTQMHSHIQHLSVPFFDKNEVGRVMSRIQNDVNQLQEFLPMVVLAVGDMTSLGAIIGFMVFMNLKLSLTTFTVIPMLVILMAIWKKYATPAFIRVRQAISIVNGNLQQNISGVRVIQSLNRENINFENFDYVNHIHLKSNLSAIRITSTLMPSVEILTAIALSSVLLIGGKMVLNNPSELGDLIAFSLFVQRFFDPIRNLSMQYTQFQRAMTAGTRIFELLDIEPEVIEHSNAIKLPNPIKGEIRYDSVNFHYSEGTPVLHDVNLHIKSGQTIALVGQTGAGKTTMISLLTRFYDVVNGRITVDGYDIRKISRASLTQQMSMVQQEPFLFSGTIAENIRYRQIEVSDKQIEQAARSVNAHDFIIKLKNGYNTLLQERGGNLSIGQRQLISFARAIVGEPQVIILDEATANVDTNTELMIQDGVDAMLKRRTAIVIAHRLSTIEKADAIVVMDKGRIVDIGTHNELLAREGLYLKLHTFNFQKV